jgi:hypothetical protein
MKRALVSVIAAGLATVALSSVSFAGANENAKIQLHLMSPTTKNQCPRAVVPCQSIITQGNLYPALYYAYVLVTDGNAAAGISGTQFGIAYDGPGAADGIGIDIYGWTLCATLEFITPAPAWPNSGGGNLITWVACQVAEPGGPGTGVVANAGYFYMAAYTPGTMRITPRPVDSSAKVADCNAFEDIIESDTVTRTPSHLGTAGFGTGNPGYNPCGLNTATQATTWSNVKSIYSSN